MGFISYIICVSAVLAVDVMINTLIFACFVIWKKYYE